ncbi:MAG: PilZ domain-containing protein [Oscillibacter sp.]|nr:PilZ domain-containing protein [Oscillibacter sp.]
MGLFDFLKRHKSPPPAEETPPPPAEKQPEGPPPELYDGMRIEVMTPENHLLYVGRLKIYSASILEIRSESDGELPRALYKQAVKLRGFQRNSEAFTLNGTICHSSPAFWHVENIRFLQREDQRSFFRQNTDTEATFVLDGHWPDEAVPCRILDLSAGGLRITTKEQLPVGSIFHISTALLENEDPFTITCQIRRAAEQQMGSFEYGCQFIGLPPKDQERLLQVIFVLQRKMLQARRDF